MRIGATEIILVLIVALLVIGPEKLPAYAKKFGEALAVFKKATSDATKDIQESVVEPLNEAQKPLQEAIEPIETTRKEIRGQVEGVQKSLDNIGKKHVVLNGNGAKSSSEKNSDSAAAASDGRTEAVTEVGKTPAVKVENILEAEEIPGTANTEGTGVSGEVPALDGALNSEEVQPLKEASTREGFLTSEGGSRLKEVSDSGTISDSEEVIKESTKSLSEEAVTA